LSALPYSIDHRLWQSISHCEIHSDWYQWYSSFGFWRLNRLTESFHILHGNTAGIFGTEELWHFLQSRLMVVLLGMSLISFLTQCSSERWRCQWVCGNFLEMRVGRLIPQSTLAIWNRGFWNVGLTFRIVQKSIGGRTTPISRTAGVRHRLLFRTRLNAISSGNMISPFRPSRSSGLSSKDESKFPNNCWSIFVQSDHNSASMSQIFSIPLVSLKNCSSRSVRLGIRHSQVRKENRDTESYLDEIKHNWWVEDRWVLWWKQLFGAKGDCA
jgi:hypothetical protein